MKKTKFIQTTSAIFARMRNQNKYEYRLLLLLSGLMTFVIIVGSIIFYQINSLNFKAKLDNTENTSILLMKDIERTLLLADNIIDMYSLQQDASALERYNQQKITAIHKMDSLVVLQENTIRHKSAVIIKDQILERLQLMDTMLLLESKQKNQDALGEVISEITNAKIYEKINIPQQTETPKKTGFKLFKRNKSEAPATIKVSTDGVKRLNQQIKNIQNEQSQKTSEVNAVLVDLKQKSKILSLAIDGGFARFEKGIVNELELEAMKIADSGKTLSYVLVVFSFLMATLIGISIYSIFIYIRKNNSSKKELELAKQYSDELAQSKERFLANMSHEIRTPLTAISGFAELLNKEKMPDYQKEKVQIIAQSSAHLTELINQILDLTKLQSNKMTVEEISFDLKNELNWISKVLEEQVKKHNNEFKIVVAENVPDHLLGDPMKLKQIMLNLCSNAVKFTENGLIEINLQAAQLTSKEIELRIKVIDNGLGISVEKQESIFNEFEQAETSTQRKFGGTGLGLSITKKLVELLNGKLFLQSQPGKGTSITVQVPMNIASQPKAKEIQDNSEQLKMLSGKNILVVDDEPFNRKLLTTLLQQHNIFTAEAENGKEAIEKIKNDHYDMVFMDLRMPIMDGKSAVNFIRKELNISPDDLCIIALTANAQLLNAEEWSLTGFNAFMEKPFTENKLLEALQNPKYTKPMETSENGLYDLSNLRQLSNDDEEFFEEMVTSFVQTTREGLTAIQKAKDTENWPEVAEMAHKIASPCSHLEAKRMHNLLRTIENNCRYMKNIDETHLLIQELGIVVSEIITAMSKETGFKFKVENN